MQSRANHPTAQQDRDRPEGDVETNIGVIRNVRFDPGVGAYGALVADWVVVDEPTRLKARNAARAGVLEQFAFFSVNARAAISPETIEVDGVTYDVFDQFLPHKLNSVDLVTAPAAGGRFLTRLAASLRASTGDKSMSFAELQTAKPQLVAMLLGAENPKALATELELETDDTFWTDFGAAQTTSLPKPAAVTETPKPKLATVTETPKPEPATVTETASPEQGAEADTVAVSAETVAELVEQKVAAALRPQILDTKLGATDLPEVTKTRLRAALANSNPGEMDAAITAAGAVVVELRGSTQAHFPGTGYQAGNDSADLYAAGIDGLFAREDQIIDGTRVPRFHNVREAMQYHPEYVGQRHIPATRIEAALKGTRVWADEYGTQVIRASNAGGGWVRIRAATSTTVAFGEIFADRAHKRMMTLLTADQSVEEIIAWASDKVQFDDFKTHRAIDLGEFEDPVVVAEAATYTEWAAPADTEETQSLNKVGGRYLLTMEMLTDPDGQKIARLPDRMIQSMINYKRKTLINTITTTNANMGDSTALYAAGHNNQSTTALHPSSINDVRVAMRSQTIPGSASRPAGRQLGPWGIIVPNELQALAERINSPTDHFIANVTNGGTDATFDPGMWKGQLRILVADHFTNATDWYTQADPMKAPTWEYATLRGVNQPEFFSADAEESTAMMASDSITWKVRDFFSSTPLNYRSFYYQNVA